MNNVVQPQLYPLFHGSVQLSVQFCVLMPLILCNVIFEYEK